MDDSTMFLIILVYTAGTLNGLMFVNPKNLVACILVFSCVMVLCTWLFDKEKVKE